MVKVQARKGAKRVARSTVRNPGGFGPVSTINTAPVSVGNSVRGSKPRISQTTDGARVVGRDFAFALSSTAAAINGWELIGSMPITPCALPSSVLRNYCQMFQKFKVNKVTAHYITSSPTSQAGDIVFYYERDALAPMVDYSNSSFLPYILSDPHTVIGPQWTNHSALINPVSEWKSTLYGNQTDLNEDKAGVLHFFSKTNSANSPGYLLIDYDISFKSLAVNPRAGTLPIARAQGTFMCGWQSGLATTAGNAFIISNTNTGKNIADSAGSTPSGISNGDIYKVVLQITASTQANAAWTNVTKANLLQFADNTSLPVDDGTTLYARVDNGVWNFFSTFTNACTSTSPIEYGVTATISFALCWEAMLVGNIDTLTQSSY